MIKVEHRSERRRAKKREKVSVEAVEGGGGGKGRVGLYDDMLLCSALLRKTP